MDTNKLALKTIIQEIPDWDSGAFLAMIAELDEEFKLNITIEQVAGKLANIKTIGEFLELLGL
jgi:acyl carrier protein